MPIAGIKSDEPRAALEANGRFPSDEPGVAWKRVGLIKAGPDQNSPAGIGIGFRFSTGNDFNFWYHPARIADEKPSQEQKRAYDPERFEHAGIGAILSP